MFQVTKQRTATHKTTKPSDPVFDESLEYKGISEEDLSCKGLL